MKSQEKNKPHFMFQCSFCGGLRDDCLVVITGPEVSICNNCNEIATQQIKQILIDRLKKQAMLGG